MFLKAAINGGRSRDEAPDVPLTPEEIALASSCAVRLGADVVHVHARTPEGGQSIHPDAVGEMVRAVRAHDPSVVVGTTTGLWTCSGHEQRMRYLAAWPEAALPDFASVTFVEEGAAEASALVLERGMVLESAVWSMDDVPALLASPTLHDNVRILIEPEVEDAAAAVAECRAIAAALRDAGVRCPLLYHGFDRTAWPVLRAAIEDGVEGRIGLEDVLVLADGTRAGNEAMIRDAVALAHAAESERA